MRLHSTEPFVQEYERLPERLQKQVDKALAFLLMNLRHASLRAKKMEGQRDRHGRDIWEARVSRHYRLTFTIDEDTYILYRVGTHDIERHPY